MRYETHHRQRQGGANPSPTRTQTLTKYYDDYAQDRIDRAVELITAYQEHGLTRNLRQASSILRDAASAIDYALHLRHGTLADFEE